MAGDAKRGASANAKANTAAAACSVVESGELGSRRLASRGLISHAAAQGRVVVARSRRLRQRGSERMQFSLSFSLSFSFPLTLLFALPLSLPFTFPLSLPFALLGRHSGVLRLPLLARRWMEFGGEGGHLDALLQDAPALLLVAAVATVGS